MSEPARTSNALGPRRRVAVVTGTRAEFGLLQPVMRAIKAHPDLDLLIVACGAHLVAPAETFREVKEFARQIGAPVADSVPMQVAGRTGRAEDVEAVGRGLQRFARAFAGLKPDWVVVLGDRIEAFAAAASASIGGFGLAHIHGGDRAEGIADEAMRHAISKLAHLHLAATPQSGERLVRMGERPEHVLVTGSPAIDELDVIAPMSDADAAPLGDPGTVVLLHPSGLEAASERALAHAAVRAADMLPPDVSDLNVPPGMASRRAGQNVLWLAPNLDSGREHIAEVLRARVAASTPARRWVALDHLPRPRFLALLKRLAATEGALLVGNSSAGLIEAAALRMRVLNLGPRQDGRERSENVVDVAESMLAFVDDWAMKARQRALTRLDHPFGDGTAGTRIAAALARIDPRAPDVLRKRCTY